MRFSLLSFLSAVWILAPGLSGREYFVSQQGDDTQPGTSRDTAMASIQKAVDILQPGDTLTIAPGEYFEAVKRADLGSLEKETIIRAEIPGTVLLRGDRPAPAFRPVEGKRFVFEADFDFQGEIPAVNEIDTLTILKRLTDAAELEFVPGAFAHDAAAGKLYLSSSDFRPAMEHRYSVSVIPATGVHLIRPRRVTIEGVAVTGFSARGLVHYREETAGGVWGIFLVHGKDCVVRDCRAYLNAWGIGLQSGPPGCGDNLIERCVAWANKSPFANGDMGGISAFAARRDRIRGCTAYLNGVYGINIYGTGGAPPNYKDDGGNLPENRSMLDNNLAWGNERADLKIKTGYEYHHLVRGSVGVGLCSMVHVEHSLLGSLAGEAKDTRIDNTVLGEHAGLDAEAEFADPANHDYRLQATSRFRGAGKDGGDLGPFPFTPNVFFLSPDGDDQADGLSVAGAWKTLGHAAGRLRPGDTLYLEPGEYAGDAAFTGKGPVFMRGRGTGEARLAGKLSVAGGREIALGRLHLAGGLDATDVAELRIEHCVVKSAEITRVEGFRSEHCRFDGALTIQQSTAVDLRGNRFEQAPRLDDPASLRHADYNGHRDISAAWEIGGRSRDLAELPAPHERHSRDLDTASGPFGVPIGPFTHRPRREPLRLVVPPAVHSLSATTANLEWTVSRPATCQIAWGETPACEQRASFDVAGFGTYSLTGLKPGRRYYFRIESLATPANILPKTEPQNVTLGGEPITFTTQANNAAPATYYVANDGDDSRGGLSRDQAWRTISHAAAKVNAGDTVLIAGGRYRERVRLRATGEAGRPISFRAMPGERVEMDGGGQILHTAFVAGGKNHLRFDGFYFNGFNLFPNDSWYLGNSGEFHLYRGRDIEISRCFSEGRGGYSALPVSAHYVEDLHIVNCVNTFKFGGMYFWRCPNLRVAHCVFAGPMIQAFVHRNEKQQPAIFEHCVFTDMLDKKARLNLGLLCCDGSIDSFVVRDSGLHLRDCIPLEERVLNGGLNRVQLGPHLVEPLFEDPRFAGDPGDSKDPTGFGTDRLMDAAIPLDFDSFFATHPDYLKRGIGLQPEAFADFRFHRQATAR